MLAMPSQIEMYQDMSALSTRMVEAARANDWDRLIDLERSVAALRDGLMAVDDSSLSQQDVSLKAALIRRVLEDDAEVRRHTEPWMEQVRRFLGDGMRRLDIEKAYAAGAGDSAGSLGA